MYITLIFQKIQEAKCGIFYARESLNATFNSDSEMVLRAIIKKMSDI